MCRSRLPCDSSGCEFVKKIILITGADGFTGRYIAQELRGPNVVICGLFSSAPSKLPPSIDRALVCNLLDRTSLAQQLAELQPALVAHLAAISFVAHGDAEEIYRTNIVGTRNLLEALAGLNRPPSMTLLASSANIYGNASVDSINESTAPAPANDYAVSKLAMEYMAKLYADRLPMVTVRPFNYTGVGQSEKFLIPKIVSHIRRRAPAIELGNIDVARDFSDVRMVAQCYRQLLERPEVAGRTFNVCSGHAHTLREVIALCKEISGHSLDVQVNPAFVRANEVKVLKGDKTALTQAVGEVAEIPLRETLRWMIEVSA